MNIKHVGLLAFCGGLAWLAWLYAGPTGAALTVTFFGLAIVALSNLK